ncbi:DeoR/GlpR transcriptional regulator [Pseudovibrio exalbescens]|uniref:DeoR/GlpR family DNA-binding transcription regulator n=1 Tax=Pseudovibrio exalbescens TaxID=197461 RepID=UPI002365E29D|nr:DeoR/GlpR transcriptional regulator [Pseudovibrio exalbescens]MDD7910190.1 DeoR/GlpR transcriptional regulator [Pseudovibrio exalbescens]
MVSELMVDVLANLVKRYRRIELKTVCEILNIDPSSVGEIANSLALREHFDLYDDTLFYLAPREEDRYSVRLRSHYTEKFAIGQLAATLFRPGDHLMIEAGSTMTIFTQNLTDVPGLRISTNNYAVASHMVSSNSTCQVRIIGGHLKADGGGCMGELAEANVRATPADWAIISPVGVSAEGEIMYYDAQEASFARAMSQSCTKTIVLCDSSKVGVPSRHTAIEPQDVDYFITDSYLKPLSQARLMRSGLRALRIAQVEVETASEIVMLDV